MCRQPVRIEARARVSAWSSKLEETKDTSKSQAGKISEVRQAAVQPAPNALLKVIGIVMVILR